MNAAVEDVVEYCPVDPAITFPSAPQRSASLRTIQAAIDTQTLYGGRVIRVARAKAHREPTIPIPQERPGRPLEKHSSEADVALEAWARWARSALSGLGWAPRTLLARVIEFGAFGAASRGGMASLEADELCELVERAVMRLKDIERKVIVTRYLFWQPIEVSARYCRMSTGRFRTVLSAARRSVGDYLEGSKLLFEQIPP
ncbi:MAG: hypothetical protein JWO52_4065 [Gammaproteobacteria bacterium]|jgi:DNA-directed RNA polymerase specialized sigma24 family protein|nr:hypothetical protein [Gammaproteobacteria bacterium]